jgi:uncharacterized protein YabN with tetrapyrrole methylase and pyrophosphatase domain
MKMVIGVCSFGKGSLSGYQHIVLSQNIEQAISSNLKLSSMEVVSQGVVKFSDTFPG